jgi:hypothetical protein
MQLNIIAAILTPWVRLLQSSSQPAPSFDPLRTIRMFGYGLCWYGPCQFYWYNLLEHVMPVKNTANFISKVSN